MMNSVGIEIEEIGKKAIMMRRTAKLLVSLGRSRRPAASRP